MGCGLPVRTEAAVVARETLTVDAADPLSTTELGDTVQVDDAGAPAHVNVTIWLKPPVGETATVKFAVCPGDTVLDVEEIGPSEKSSPVPLSATVCGLPGALSLIVNVPGRVPPAVGSKKTPTEQLVPAATVLPQALISPKSAALDTTLVIRSGALPLFVRVTL